MAKRKRSKGLGNESSDKALGWYVSAGRNFDRIRAGKQRGCSAVEHYTDVVVEATVAETLAVMEQRPVLVAKAAKLARTATRAQRGAVALCRRG